MDQDLQDEYQRRGIVGIFLMAVPITMIVMVGIGYLMLYYVGYNGRAAEGDRSTITFDGCAEARPFVEKRVEAMGLPAPVFADTPNGFTLSTVMPSRAQIAEKLPETLARPGTFSLHRLDADRAIVEGDPILTEADIETSELNMTFLDTPRVRIAFDKAGAKTLREWMETHPDEGLELRVDGRRVTTRANMPPEITGKLDIDLDHAPDLARLDFVVSTAIVLEHGPLPCEPTIAGVSKDSPPAP